MESHHPVCGGKYLYVVRVLLTPQLATAADCSWLFCDARAVGLVTRSCFLCVRDITSSPTWSPGLSAPGASG